MSPVIALMLPLLVLANTLVKLFSRAAEGASLWLMGIDLGARLLERVDSLLPPALFRSIATQETGMAQSEIRLRATDSG